MSKELPHDLPAGRKSASVLNLNARRFHCRVSPLHKPTPPLAPLQPSETPPATQRTSLAWLRTLSQDLPYRSAQRFFCAASSTLRLESTTPAGQWAAISFTMKAAPLLVSWHNENAPIYSAHFEPQGKGRLATAGGDNNVRVSGGSQDTLLVVAHHRLALECRITRRGAESDLSLDPRQAHTSSQRRTMVSARLVPKRLLLEL